jgi:ribonuclease G
MKRLFIDCRPDCARTAHTVDGKLKEIYIDPLGSESLVGHIYVGRLQNILPGQFAFVDIGVGKNAFINLPRNHTLKKGQPVLMQVYKDAYDEKGPYGGQQLKLKGRLVIIHESHRGEIGVSSKITDPSERSRLRRAVHGVLEKGYGAIVRTKANGHTEEEIITEAVRLISLHREIIERAQYAMPPALMYPEKAALQDSLLVDLLTDDLDEIWISGGDFERIKQACEQVAPELKDNLFFHEDGDKGDLFDIHNITRQMERALEKTVWLPCGGYITFEQTEACVVIDVNTGAFSGEQNYRAAILQTNMEAAAAISAQLALRNLSGMIIVDFIDMKDRQDKTTLMNALAREIKKDRIKTEIVSMTELGLVQLTRRKSRPPLNKMLQTDCPHCKGSGKITAQTHTKNQG